MRTSFATAVAALACQAVAFPSIDLDLNEIADRAIMDKRQVFGINIKFDAKSQYVSNQGQYKFVAPKPSDIRGPCPGLNAMANHGYIPHNGIATIDQFIKGTYQVFGMSFDLAAFLAVYGAVFDGDLVSWSIGGPPPASLLSPLSGLIGQPQGLTGSHNKYEGDASPTRGDLYQVGSNDVVILDQFKRLYAYQADKTEATSNYDLGVLTSFRKERFRESIEKNPYFTNAAFSGVLVQPAAYTFIYRFMSNKSAEFPEGRLSQKVLKSFFSITGDKPDNFKYTPGHERIPDNWYKRALGDEYSIPFFALDVVSAALGNPEFLNIGGNTGTVNTFTGVDLQDISGGIINLQTLLKGNTALCFVNQMVLQLGPDSVEGLLMNVGKALGILNPQLGKFAQALGCPQLADIDYPKINQAMQQFPGVSKLKADGTY